MLFIKRSYQLSKYDGNNMLTNEAFNLPEGCVEYLFKLGQYLSTFIELTFALTIYLILIKLDRATTMTE